MLLQQLRKTGGGCSRLVIDEEEFLTMVLAKLETALPKAPEPPFNNDAEFFKSL
jgi:hypothetical protein